MVTMDPASADFDPVAWEAALQGERRVRAEERRRRDREWRRELATRLDQKDGPSTAPSCVSVPIPGAGPGEPAFRLVRQS